MSDPRIVARRIRWIDQTGSAEGGCLLLVLLIFLIAAIVFMFTGDGFCFEYC